MAALTKVEDNNCVVNKRHITNLLNKNTALVFKSLNAL